MWAVNVGKKLEVRNVSDPQEAVSLLSKADFFAYIDCPPISKIVP